MGRGGDSSRDLAAHLLGLERLAVKEEKELQGKDDEVGARPISGIICTFESCCLVAACGLQAASPLQPSASLPLIKEICDVLSFTSC